MNGSTLTSSGSLGYVSSDWTIKGVGDFNGDGKTDILWRNSTTGQVYLWLINGTVMSGGGSVTYITSDWVIQGIGDFNGDGDADILWRNTTTGEVYIWLMNGSTLTSSGSLGYVSSDWSIAGVGDFNGDGKSDILWRNTTTGQVYLWAHQRDCDVGRRQRHLHHLRLGHSGNWRFQRRRQSRHPVAEQHHGAGLHLADEREHVDEQRQPRRPRQYLADCSIGLDCRQYGNNDFGNIAG